MNEKRVMWVAKMWAIGALLYTMCTTGFIRCIEGVKIIPGIAAKNFDKEEKVDIMLNKLTCVHTQISLDYYAMPFCKPKGGIIEDQDAENLGDLLMGDKIQNSPYAVHMAKAESCKVLCKPITLSQEEAQNLKIAVRFQYHHNWLADHLPAAYVVSDQYGGSNESEPPQIEYWGGFPLGTCELDSGHSWPYPCYLNNHMRLILDYHVRAVAYSDTGTKYVYRLVGFKVEPFSVDHKLKDSTKHIIEVVPDGNYEFETCPRSTDPNYTLNNDNTSNRVEIKAGATILFTYDVVWNKKDDVTWGTRWDRYLHTGHTITKSVHWLNIVYSFVVVVILSASIGMLLIKNLNRDIVRYNRVPTDEERADDREETGWKLVHADVFRPPAKYPMIFCVAVGTGAQLLLASFTTTLFASIGFLSPANRGSLLMAALLAYALSGSVSGYLSARLYKTFKGQRFRKCALTSALFFPGIAFAIFMCMNIVLHYVYHSTEVVSVQSVFQLLSIWLVVCLPLVLCGSYFGYNKPEIEFPVSTSNIPRQIPRSPSFLSPWCTIPIGGLLPFIAVIIEMYCVMSDIWMNEYYYIFGFLLLIFLILIMTCADVAIVYVYIQLCAEDYNWWWRSFLIAGSTAFYLFIFCCWYFTKLHATLFMTYMLYFGYMAIMLLGFFLTCGSIGFGACLWFNRKIFSTVKVD